MAIENEEIKKVSKMIFCGALGVLRKATILALSFIITGLILLFMWGWYMHSLTNL